MAGDDIGITVPGNLTADPELRFTHNGTPVVNFTIASTPRVFDKQANEFRDGETVYLKSTAWRELAENIAETLVKGTAVIAEGKLVCRPYTTKENEQRKPLELDVDSIGPDLRRASAKVTKNPRKNGGQQNQNNSQSQGGGAAPRGNSQPQGGQQSAANDDPWASGGGTAANDDPWA